MKVIFAGTPDFAAPTLQALLKSSHQVIAVLTQPDRPSGRGQKLQASPVKLLAQQHRIPIFQPVTLRDTTIQNNLSALKADVMIVVAYGLILPEAVLRIPKFGCINIHPSLLPRWRGAAPIQRTIEAGDYETAITIIQMDKGMDTGPILKQEVVSLHGNETSESLHQALSQKGATILLNTLDALSTIVPRQQGDMKATHAKKIEKSESNVDWSLSADVIERKIRAFNPWPSVCVMWKSEAIKIREAKIFSSSQVGTPGTLFITENNQLYVSAGENSALEILSLQLPGKKTMSAIDFIHGYGKNLS